MAVTSINLYSNISPYPKSWYWQNTNWAAKTVSVAADRYKLTSPSAIQVDVGGLSLTNEVAQELDLSLDATWDFGQSTVGTWTAGHSYAVGDWVRPSAATLADGSKNGSTAYGIPKTYGDGSGNSVDGPDIFITATNDTYSMRRNAFNQRSGSDSDNWNTGTITLPQSIMCRLLSPVCINKYRIQTRNGSNNHTPSAWILQGTNDNNAVVGDATNINGWTTLDSQTGISDPGQAQWTSYFSLSNSTAYLKYRMVISAVGGGDTVVQIGEIHLVSAPSLVYKCTTQGTALSTEPTWGTTVGGTTAESGGPTWTCYYDDKVASNRAGVDYYIYSCIGTTTVPKLLVSRNSTYPHGYTASNSRKIAGFHCLCASAGTISAHPLTGYLTGDILPTTVWDLKKRCKNTGNNNNGMAYIAPLDDWWAIYLASGTATAPVSIYNATILDTIDWNDSVDAGRAVGMRLPRDGEFQVAAALSNEQTNIYGSADPVTTGGHVDTAGRRMISKYGLEDCCGVSYQFLDEQGWKFTGAAVHYHKIVTITGNAETATSDNATAVDGTTAQDMAPVWAWYNLPLDKGQLYGQGGVVDCKMVAGGYASLGSHNGSRCRQYTDTARWSTWSLTAFRLCCQNQVK